MCQSLGMPNSLPTSISSGGVSTPPVDSLRFLRLHRLEFIYAVASQHTNSHIMEYRVISLDSHLSKHYALICICTGCMSELSSYRSNQ